MDMSYYTEFFDSPTYTEKRFAPKQLFTEGDLSLFVPLRIAVVGCRKPTAKGIEDARHLTRTLVHHGAIIVSGLAEGNDTIAHSTAIHAGGKTIAVLGTSFDTCYPLKNTALLNKIKTDHLAISQFSPGSRVTPNNFLMRNRTIALICHATIIVEASSQTSGTSHLGWETLRFRRPLFIMKTVIENRTLSWPKQMLKSGARELTQHSLPLLFPTSQSII